ncbi:MAG: helix-hairpin-helix domain-containing protein [Prevotella sp.]|nr:helix-hairpin-helix domain-containing protein [Prevotella sp.]
MFLKEFFYLQKSDRKVLLTLLFLMAVALIVFWAVGGQYDRTESEPDTLREAPQTFSSRKPHQRHSYYKTEERVVERFPFDPNTADSTQLLRLGLSPWQVRNIYKYRAKGGIYRKPEDFAKLYGLTVKQYKSLQPYIRISEDYQPAATLYNNTREEYVRDTLKYPVKLKESEHIILNLADTSQLKKVPGIGSGWARQIVAYRERLGGFYSTDQLLDIEGFPEDALPYLQIQNPQLRKINVNKPTLNQLRQHPYIGFYRAKAIVDYRRLKGNLKSLNELSLHKDFTEKAIQRLKPYVEF